MASFRWHHVIFLGEFTLTSARHAAQHLIDNRDVSIPRESCLNLLPYEVREHQSGILLSYAQILQYCRTLVREQPELWAADQWMFNLWATHRRRDPHAEESPPNSSNATSSANPVGSTMGIHPVAAETPSPANAASQEEPPTATSAASSSAGPVVSAGGSVS